ncbi:MAG: hypothetical protein M3Q31_03335 [Actinomycetota bacterium]|nr:hypothetical protein [Actinomycetota bacterium]
MEQVDDLVHARDVPYRAADVVDQLGALELAAQEDGAVLGVDADLPLGARLTHHNAVVCAEVAAAARTGADSQGVDRFCVG